MNTESSTSIHLLVRSLIQVHGFSVQELVLRSGVSPGTISALSTRIPIQILGWMRFLSAYGCRLEISAHGQSWTVALPRVPRPLIDREIRAWKRRREVATIQHLVNAGHARADAEANARRYADNGASRLGERRASIMAKAKDLAGFHQAAGLRHVIAILVRATDSTGEDLALLSGSSLASSQLAMNTEEDGRLATLHRVLSALSARIRVLTLGGAIIEVPLCAPGPCRPTIAGPSKVDFSSRSGSIETTNRSRMEPLKILALYDKGISIGEIARKAGISRQRVDYIAKANGRPPRRISRRESNVRVAKDVLGLA